MITTIATPTPERPDEQPQAAFHPGSTQPLPFSDLFTACTEIWQTDFFTNMQRCERKRVIMPGILQVGDRDFVDGYECGKDCYFDDTYTLVWPDGTKVEGNGVTRQTYHLVRTAKQRDISSDDCKQFVREITNRKSFPGVSLSFRTGMIAGYIATCIADSCGLLCERCGAYRGQCTHVSISNEITPHSITEEGAA